MFLAERAQAVAKAEGNIPSRAMASGLGAPGVEDPIAPDTPMTQQPLRSLPFLGSSLREERGYARQGG